MKFFRFRKCISDFRESWDNSSAVTIDTNSASFPITFTCLIRMLKLTQKVICHLINSFLRVCISEPFYTTDKAGPRAILKLINHRGIMFFHTFSQFLPRKNVGLRCILSYHCFLICLLES